MSTREEILAAAERNGWETSLDGPYRQIFRRKPKVNPGKLAQLAEMMNWQLLECIEVSYSDSGGVIGAVRRTPHDQAATDGRFISSSDNAMGKNKKGQVIAWFAIELQY